MLKIDKPLSEEERASVRAGALNLAKRGKKVFPCDEFKRPLTAGGFKSATTDPDQINQWWDKFPDALIGMPTGDGLLVVDIDFPDGPDTLAKLEAKYEPLPPTLETITGSGGRHLFFNVDRGIRNSAGKLGKNIDIRCDGGYVIAPPSIIPALVVIKGSERSENENDQEKRFYRWANKTPIADAPEWLVDLSIKQRITPPTPHDKSTSPQTANISASYGQQALINEIDKLRGTGEGERNEQLNRSAFSLMQLVAGGELEESQVRTELKLAAESIGLSTDEIEKTIRSGFEAGRGEPRKAPEKIIPHQQYAEPEQPYHPERSGLNVVCIEEFLTMSFPPRETILFPWLPAQGLCMIYAPRGVGKTHLSLNIAYAVANGGEFLNWKAGKPRGVLILDGEMPGNVLQERLSSIAMSHEQEPSAPLKIITPDLQPEGMLDLSDIADQQLLAPYMDGIDLIIVDNLSTLCRTGKEDKGESWLPVQQWALQQRAAGRSVLFIHHSGKNGEQRGTSRREDVLDTIISLTRPGDYTPEQGACFEIDFVKARGLYGEDTAPVEVMLTTGEDQTQTWTIKGLEQSTTEKVAALLNEGVQQSEIAELLGVTKGAVSKAKKRAQNKGLLAN